MITPAKAASRATTLATFVIKYSTHDSSNAQRLALNNDKFIDPPKQNNTKMNKLQKDAYNNKRLELVRAGVESLKEVSKEFGNEVSQSVLDLQKTLQNLQSKEMQLTMFTFQDKRLPKCLN